jgi:hypothetical protein
MAFPSMLDLLVARGRDPVQDASEAPRLVDIPHSLFATRAILHFALSRSGLAAHYSGSTRALTRVQRL